MSTPESIETRLFGTLPDGRDVWAYTLRNSIGMSCTVINFGATISSLMVPVQGKKSVDVVLGFDSLKGYLDSYRLPNPPYIGAVVGRFAGRIGEARFSLNGQTIQLTKNHGKHHLHGGFAGFSTAYWTRIDNPEPSSNSLTLQYVSPDGEEQYPGDLTTEVTYTVSEKNELLVSFRAWCTQDSIINLTQHSYFNLDGHDGQVTNQEMMIEAGQVLEKDTDQIPTGRFLSLDGHALDYRKIKQCPDNIDHSFSLSTDAPVNAMLHSSINHLSMSVMTDQPAIHVYVGGDCGPDIIGKNGQAYHRLSGICFEAQHFPDSPNHPAFPSTLIRKGDIYTQNTRFTFFI